MTHKYNILDVIKDAATGNLKIADAAVVSTRRAICDSCDARCKIADGCTVCGCFLPAKIRLTESECPMELW